MWWIWVINRSLQKKGNFSKFVHFCSHKRQIILKILLKTSSDKSCDPNINEQWIVAVLGYWSETLQWYPQTLFAFFYVNTDFWISSYNVEDIYSLPHALQFHKMTQGKTNSKFKEKA